MNADSSSEIQEKDKAIPHSVIRIVFRCNKKEQDMERIPYKVLIFKIKNGFE
jgi:hypothetical protein